MRSIHFTPIAVVIAAALAAGVAPAKEKPKPPVPATVDCAGGDSINAALASGATAITVVGTCTENVVIEIDGVSLTGDPNSFGAIEPLDPAQPAVFVRRATGAALTDLTLDASAGQYGLWLSNADAVATNLAIETATSGSFANFAAIAFSNSQLQVFDSVIGPSDVGLTATDGGAAEITDSTVTGNVNVGIMASRGSSVDIRTGGGGGNLIQANGDGVWAIDNCVARLRSGTEVSGNSNDGVRGIRGGVFNIDSANITGNGGEGIDLFAESVVRVNGGSATGNGGSGLKLNASTGDVSGASLSGNGDRGAFALNSSLLLVRAGSALDNNAYRGIHALHGSSVEVEDSSVSNNANRGVVIANGSSARIDGSTIDANGERGVWAWHNSNIELTGGNSVTGNGSYGGRAQNGSVIHLFDDNTVTGNSNDDLSAYEQSHVEVFTNSGGLESTIGAVGVSGGSSVTMSSGTAASVSIGTGSTGNFNAWGVGAPVIVTGNIDCWTGGVSAAFASDAIAEGPGVPAGALSLGGTTSCATLIAQGF